MAHRLLEFLLGVAMISMGAVAQSGPSFQQCAHALAIAERLERQQPNNSQPAVFCGKGNQLICFTDQTGAAPAQSSEQQQQELRDELHRHAEELRKLLQSGANP